MRMVQPNHIRMSTRPPLSLAETKRPMADSPTTSVGGLIGYLSSTITQCHGFNTVHGYYSVGGLVGQNEGTIKYCYSTGSASESDLADVGRIGGLVGDNGGVIAYSYSSAHVTGRRGLGGFIGASQYGAISNCYATGRVEGNLESGSIGGFAGFYGSDIINCYSTGLVTGSESDALKKIKRKKPHRTCTLILTR